MVWENHVTSTFTDLKIAELCRSGALLGEIGRINSDDAEPGSLLNRCVALHNAGQIDLLALTETQQFAELSGPAFFDRQHFFCKAIPFLDATVPTLVQAVQSLVVKGGNDLASSLPRQNKKHTQA
jgi:hypothetical protein